MPYTSTTTSHLQQYAKTVRYVFELRTHHAESSEWAEVPFADFTLTREGAPGLTPAVLSISLLNDSVGATGSLSAERDPANPAQLLAQARLTCIVGAGASAESEVLFEGRVWRIEPRDFGLALTCQDWLALCGDCECEVSLAPEETSEITTPRALSLIEGGAFGSLYGFTYTGGGDSAFNADSPAGTRRRAWAAGDIRLYYDGAGASEVPPALYQVHLTSGAVSILEDTSGKSYYAAGVRCYIEGTLDWSAVFEAALTYPRADGGMGVDAAQLDLPPLGLDCAAPVYFRGRVSEFLAQLLSVAQQNLRLWYESSTGKYKLRIVEQQDSADWTLLHAQSIAQPRDIAELYSRVVATGLSERPRSALTESGVSITNLATGDWFPWNGLNVGGDDAFADVFPALYDGDANTAASVHNLDASVAPGTDKYTSWYPYIQIDLGGARRLSRIRAVMPGSRNMNASAGHQGIFWPGLRVLVSLDGSDWRLASALLCGRFAPREKLEARGREILCPKARYIKVLLGAYKHGLDNQSDPSIGLSNFEVYTAEEYRVVKEIDGRASPASYYSYTADYDGDGSADTWPRNAPGLWERLGGDSSTGLGGVHRTRFIDLSGEVNEALAHDRALDLLAEGVRLFQQCRYTAVCDPRVKLYDTVVAPDELNGPETDPGAGSPALPLSFLVERIVLRPSGTEISGTDYRGEGL